MPPEETPWRPENVPDMSLPERGSQPPPSDGAPPGSGAGYVMVPMPARSWKVGDRVLAPWEPQFLYVGEIREIRGEKACVQFSDGDAGWVLLRQVQPLLFKRGQKVLSRRRMGPLFFPVTLVDVEGDSVLVKFDDGQPDERTTIASLRVPCEATGPMAEITTVASHLAFQDNLRLGERVWAPWASGVLFVGTVNELNDAEALIHFDDGDRGWVRVTQLMPMELIVGMLVLGRWKMGDHYYPGTITEVRGRQVHIQYDDGDREWTTTSALAIPCQPTGPDARPAGASAWNPALNWLIPIGIGLLLCVLRVGCRSM